MVPPRSSGLCRGSSERTSDGLFTHGWITGTDTVVEHNEKLLWVHDRLKSERLYISRKKFEPFGPVLDILGCKVDSDGVHADSDKMAKLRAWHEPADHWEVLRFLGLIEYLA